MLVVNVSTYTEDERVETAIFRLKRNNIDTPLAIYGRTSNMNKTLRVYR